MMPVRGRTARPETSLRKRRGLPQQTPPESAGARAPAPPPEAFPSKAEPLPPTPTTLAFRNGRTEQVFNYAIVGGVLWIINEQEARKVPLSELDLAATKKVNAEHGTNFPIPRR
jgi:hypothetical protein